MIVVSNRIYVNPDHAEAFEERFKERANLVDGMPGFIAFQLLRPNNPEDPYTVMTFWESVEDYKRWTQSDAFKQGHAQSGTLPEDTFTQRPVLEVSEVIMSTAHIQPTDK